MKVAAIAAMDEGRVIGVSGKLPWELPEDLKRFKKLTMGHTVLMGRKTFESIPERFRPLPGRMNVVASSSEDAYADDGIRVCADACAYIEAVRAGREEIQGDILWIIGGEQIYRATKELWDEVVLTLVQGRRKGDAFFPEFESEFEEISSDAGDGCSFFRFIRRRS